MLPNERLQMISQKIHENLTKNDLDKIYTELKKLYSLYSSSLSTLCVTKVESSTSLTEIWNILLKVLGKQDMIDLVKIALNDRPLDLVKNSATYRTILVLCIFAVVLRDTQLLNLVLYVYSFIRFYSTFVARLKICDADVIRIALDRLTLKSIIKQKNGNYSEVCIRIMDHFYTNYVKNEFEVHNPDIYNVILKIVIILDYSRTRLKEVQNVLIRTYYDVYNEKDKYTTHDALVQQRLHLHNHVTHIFAKFLQICKSEVTESVYSKNLVPQTVAKCLCSYYLKNDDFSFEVVRKIVSIIDKNVTVDPCSHEFSYQIRRLFVKKTLQPLFKEIDDANYKILQNCNLDTSKWLSYMKRHTIYKLNTRNYAVFLVYMAIVRTLCTK